LPDTLLVRATFTGNFSEANLYHANLTGANLHQANLTGANLSEARLDGANLSLANLSGADLSKATLFRTDLSRAILEGTIFSYATAGSTIFGEIDLSTAKGLDTVHHSMPSTIGIDTIYRSRGKIPESFLRKVGVPDSFLEVMAAITNRPIEYYAVFISYSSQDRDFAERLYADLQSKGVRCWFAPEDLKIGDKIRPRIDESIHLYDKLLLVLSQHSVASQWVEQEVETALSKERKEHHTMLFPIRLDKTVLEIDGGWPALIRNTRNIGDFTRWKRHDAYQKSLDRLLRDLKAEA
jgi:hypothetical protein